MGKPKVKKKHEKKTKPSKKKNKVIGFDLYIKFQEVAHKGDKHLCYAFLSHAEKVSGNGHSEARAGIIKLGKKDTVANAKVSALECNFMKAMIGLPVNLHMDDPSLHAVLENPSLLGVGNQDK